MPEEQSGSAGVQAPGVPTVRDMDIVYQEVERLYYEISKGCGLSETAYWILVDIVVAGGSCPQGSIATCHSLSPRDRADLVALVRRYVVAIDLEMQALHADGCGPAASGPAESAGEARPHVR